MEFVDVAIIGVEDAIQIFGIPIPETFHSNLIQDPSPLAETLCHLRIKSAPFFMDLKFKSALLLLDCLSYP
jgi:hypothetical protein